MTTDHQAMLDNAFAQVAERIKAAEDARDEARELYAALQTLHEQQREAARGALQRAEQAEAAYAALKAEGDGLWRMVENSANESRRLREAMERAPHAHPCWAAYNDCGWRRKFVMPERCNCWKREALAAAPGQEAPVARLDCAVVGHDKRHPAYPGERYFCERCGEECDPPSPEPPAAAPVEDEWWCAMCGEVVPSHSVTYRETHDERDGGCGVVVTSRPKAPAAAREVCTHDYVMRDYKGWICACCREPRP